MKIKEIIASVWQKIEFSKKQQFAFWLVLLISMLIMSVNAYRNFEESTSVMTLSLILFVVNSLLFFTVPEDAPRIREAMLLSLIVLVVGCFVYYLFMSATAAV